MVRKKKNISVKLDCGITVSVPPDISDATLVLMNEQALKEMNRTVGNKKPGRLF